MFSVKYALNFLHEIDLQRWWHNFRRSVVSFSPQSDGFFLTQLHVGFVVGKVALGKGLLRQHRFHTITNTP